MRAASAAWQTTAPRSAGTACDTMLPRWEARRREERASNAFGEGILTGGEGGDEEGNQERVYSGRGRGMIFFLGAERAWYMY